MSPLLKKLNYKNQINIYVNKAPSSFAHEIKEINKYISVSLNANAKEDFYLFFVQTPKDIEEGLKIIKKNKGEYLLWFAYPKQSSKKYTSEINRDKGWKALGDLGFEPVRAVAIDEDWSSLRFKKVEQIKKMIRRGAMTLSEAGKTKTINKSDKAVDSTNPLVKLGQTINGSILSQMFGKSCLKLHGKAFMAWHNEACIFKLNGKEREAALILKGTVMWDPSGKGRPMKDWISVPSIHKSEYKRLATIAAKLIS
jgi:hypothetical protein